MSEDQAYSANEIRAARARAIIAHVERFSPGCVCRKGHFGEWYIDGSCITCDEIKRPRYQSAHRDYTRAHIAARDGYAPPPLERDCPPRPSDGRCDCCLVLVTGKGKSGFHLDHDHVTGAFRGWVCSGCNCVRGAADNPDKLRTRADFLDVKLPWQ